MALNEAFSPQNLTVVIAAAATAPTGVRARTNVFDLDIKCAYRIVNAGTTTVFLGVGDTAAAAQSRTAAPIAGAPSAAIPILAGAIEVLVFKQGSFFSGLSSSAATVHITAGDGL